MLRAELHPFRLALKTPLVTGGISIRARAGFLVALHADGISGWGEASPLPGWSRTSLLDTEAALRSAVDALERSGEAVLDTLLAEMHDTPHARAGVAGAWADLQARRAGQRLAEHLLMGRRCAPASEVAVNALITVLEPSEVEQAAHAAAETGFNTLKLKVGAVAPALDAARIRAARAGLGRAAELRLDANGAWDTDTAVDVLGRVRDCDIAYCEEPVAGIDAIAAVGQRSSVPVAVDESIRSESDAVRALNAGIGTLIVKPQALGGSDIATSIADRAHQAAASVIVTSFLDSAVGLAHGLHTAAAVDATTPGSRRAHGLATADLFSADVADPPAIASGTVCLSRSPGIGVVPAPPSRPTTPG